jgi:hypothetical protein
MNLLWQADQKLLSKVDRSGRTADALKSLQLSSTELVGACARIILLVRNPSIRVNPDPTFLQDENAYRSRFQCRLRSAFESIEKVTTGENNIEVS